MSATEARLRAANEIIAEQNQALATAHAAGTALTPMDMLHRAVSSGANMDVLEKLMALQERWEKNQARKAFDAAVAEAKAQIKPIARNRSAHNGKYVDFAAIAREVDPILATLGLSYRFRTTQNGTIAVTCILSHKDGHSEETTLSGPSDTSGSKNAIQAIGSTLTYLQRYSLVQMLGLAASNDDDGKSAVRPDRSLIDAVQAQAIRDKLASVGMSEYRFLKWAKAEKVEDIFTDTYDSCIQAILRAGANKQKGSV